ncbi:MAG: hypothetical protein RL532_1207 [Actinomycetota bacterium]
MQLHDEIFDQITNRAEHGGRLVRLPHWVGVRFASWFTSTKRDKTCSSYYQDDESNEQAHESKLQVLG